MIVDSGTAVFLLRRNEASLQQHLNLLPPPLARVESFAQAVADKVEGEHR